MQLIRDGRRHIGVPADSLDDRGGTFHRECLQVWVNTFDGTVVPHFRGNRIVHHLKDQMFSLVRRQKITSRWCLQSERDLNRLRRG